MREEEEGEGVHATGRERERERERGTHQDAHRVGDLLGDGKELTGIPHFHVGAEGLQLDELIWQVLFGTRQHEAVDAEELHKEKGEESMERKK